MAQDGCFQAVAHVAGGRPLVVLDLHADLRLVADHHSPTIGILRCCCTCNFWYPTQLQQQKSTRACPDDEVLTSTFVAKMALAKGASDVITPRD